MVLQNRCGTPHTYELKLKPHLFGAFYYSLTDMIIEVGDILKGYLSSLTFIEKLAGVVRPIVKNDLDKDNKPVRKTFPAACGLTFDDCFVNGKYQDLIPNSKLKSIVYLEENGGIRPMGRNGANYVFKASYKIVGWLNLKKLGKDECSISGKVIASIMAAIPEHPANSGIYQKIIIEIGGQDPKSQIPFSKYSYDEAITQYLMLPYDYFSLPIDVQFEVNVNCIEPFEEGEEIEC